VRLQKEEQAYHKVNCGSKRDLVPVSDKLIVSKIAKLVERQRFFQNVFRVGIRKKLQMSPWLKPTEIVVESNIRMVRYINSFCPLSLRHTLFKRPDMLLVNIVPIRLPMFDLVIAAY
jgi:hypothetical protein